MKEYAIYLFDFDGTLFDTKLSLRKVWKDAFAAIGEKATDEQCDHYMHQNLFQTLDERNVKKEDYPAFGAALTASIDDPETVAQNVPFPETKAVLDSLRAKGKRIGIVSGNSVHHIQLVLAHWGYSGIADVLVGCDVYAHGKPSPEPLLFALHNLGEAPSPTVVYVGDSLQDIEAADAAGIESFLIDREEEHPDFPRPRLKGLAELLS